jgi:hypothetical protein
LEPKKIFCLSALRADKQKISYITFIVQRFALNQNPEIFLRSAQSNDLKNISVLLKASIGCKPQRNFGKQRGALLPKIFLYY